MDNLLIKERDKLDKVSKDALEQLMFKDQIIEELRAKLSKEQLDNISMKTKLKELDEKINFLEEKLEQENSTFTMQNKITNPNNNFNNNTSENNFFNRENYEALEKLSKENQELIARLNAMQAELDVFREKSKAINEIEDIYKYQIEQLKKKSENFEILQKKLKEKENYIEEIINRYNNLQNEYEVMINNKDYEIKELKAQLNIVNETNEKFSNQLNIISKNSNSLTQDLYKEIRLLSDKNKDLELRLFKTEQKYKEEVSSLKKIFEDSKNAEGNSNNKDNELNLNKHDSTSMRVEDLATSLSKSIREKIESQNKKISAQNIEILGMQYELEKLKADLKYEKELNEKLQIALADLKCKDIQTQNNRLCYEDAQTQTIMKFEDLESFKIKAKILEDNLIKTSEENEEAQKKLNNMKEKIVKLSKESKDKEKEILQLVKKVEKLQQSDRSFEKELASVNNISKLNMTVSALKMREAELMERIQQHERERDKEKNFNINNNQIGYQITNASHISNFNKNTLQNNLNLNYNYANPNDNKFSNTNAPIDSQNNSFIGGFNNNNVINSNINNTNFNNMMNNQNPHNNNNNINLINKTNSFNYVNNSNNEQNNISLGNNNNNNNINVPNMNNNNNFLTAPSFNNINSSNNMNLNNNNSNNLNNTNTTSKDILMEKYELDIKRIQEDNYFLKDQNFRLVSENNKINECANSIKLKYAELELEKENLIREKNQLVENYERKIGDLKEELEKSKTLNNKTIDEMRVNLQSISNLNIKLNDQFNSLQNKFYVQSQLIQEKNIELQSEGKIIDSLKRDNEELIENQTKLVEKLKVLERQNITHSSEKEKLKKELDEAKNSLLDFNMKNNFAKSELDERNKILSEENKSLRDSNTQLKAQIQDVYAEIQQKDNKIISVLKEEARDLESNLRSEINSLRIKNEQLLQERSTIRLQNNELNYEVEFLKEQFKLAGVNYSSLINKDPFNANINVNASNSSDIIKNENDNNIHNNTSTSNINSNANAISQQGKNYMSYLNPIVIQSSPVNDSKKLQNAISMQNQNNSHMKEILKDNKFLEQENDFVKNENIKLQTELDCLSKRLVVLENNLKDSKLDFEALLVEKDKLSDLLHRKELELKDTNLEISILQSEINVLKKQLDDTIVEINVKNQTINKLLDNIDNEKALAFKRFGEMEETIQIIKTEKVRIEEKLENLSDQLKSERDKYTGDLNDLKRENEILIQDLDKIQTDSHIVITSHEKELLELKNTYETNKITIEKLSSENINLKEEKSILERQVNELSILSIERLEKQNDKISKSKTKSEKLVELYESHIKFLKEKFNSSLHDFILAVNFKQGILSEKETEKFKSIMKGLENTSELMNQIAGREALILNYKEEIKSLKQNLNKTSESLKKTLRENEDLQDILNVRKLQMKINFAAEKDKGKDKNKEKDKDNKTTCVDCSQKNIRIESLLNEITDLKVDEKDIDLRINSLNSEIKKLEDINKDMNERYETNQKYIENLRIEIAKKEKELLDTNKFHKNEVGKIIEELKKIKEKWISPEKFNEKVEELESKLKSAKNESNRKNDLITSLKAQITQIQNSNIANTTLNNLNTTNYNKNADNSNNNTATISLEDKVKSLQKEINRKDLAIKEFKISLENLRATEKKLSEENSALIEKNKILKIDVNRKDEIIKDYKDKYNILTMGNNKNQKSSVSNLLDSEMRIGQDVTNGNEAALTSQIKKLKNDLDRKDDIIKTLKAKLENANNEIEQMKTLNIKSAKNNYTELEKEQKRNENLRSKADFLLVKNESLISVIRRVFKDLILTYEKQASNKPRYYNSNNNNNLDQTTQSFKEGMDILNIAPDELGDYLNPDDKIHINANSTSNYNNRNNYDILNTNLNKTRTMFDNINKMLDAENIEADGFMDIFYSLKEKIFKFCEYDDCDINTNTINAKNKSANNSIFNTPNNNYLYTTNPNSSKAFLKNKNVYTSNSNALNNTNYTTSNNKKSNIESSYSNTPVITNNEEEGKFKKYQSLLNKVKGTENSNTNYNVSFDNIDGIMNDLSKINK